MSSSPPPPPGDDHFNRNKRGLCGGSSSATGRTGLRRSKTVAELERAWRREPLTDVTNFVLGQERERRLTRIPTEPATPALATPSTPSRRTLRRSATIATASPTPSNASSGSPSPSTGFFVDPPRGANDILGIGLGLGLSQGLAPPPASRPLTRRRTASEMLLGSPTASPSTGLLANRSSTRGGSLRRTRSAVNELGVLAEAANENSGAQDQRRLRRRTGSFRQ